MMKVSIVSATYNRAKLLDNALLTYSKQTKRPVKWVVNKIGRDEDEVSESLRQPHPYQPDHQDAREHDSRDQGWHDRGHGHQPRPR